MGACVVVSPRREGVHGFGASRVAPGFLSRGVNKQHKLYKRWILGRRWILQPAGFPYYKFVQNTNKKIKIKL